MFSALIDMNRSWLASLFGMLGCPFLLTSDLVVVIVMVCLETGTGMAGDERDVIQVSNALGVDVGLRISDVLAV